MIFTLENVLNSLADVLKKKYPQHPVYYSPNQQGTDFPCFFIFFMPSTIEGQIGQRFVRDLGIDIVFVQQRNLINGNVEVLAIAEYLDEALDVFPYLDKWDEGGKIEKKEDAVFIRTFERQWKSEDEELHYQFHIKQRVAVPADVIPMDIMEDDVYVKER